MGLLSYVCTRVRNRKKKDRVGKYIGVNPRARIISMHDAKLDYLFFLPLKLFSIGHVPLVEHRLCRYAHVEQHGVVYSVRCCLLRPLYFVNYCPDVAIQLLYATNDMTFWLDLYTLTLQQFWLLFWSRVWNSSTAFGAFTFMSGL